MTVKAIADRIFVRLEQKAEKTEGGIFVTPDIDDVGTVGTVESVGAEVSSVKVGDKILFHVFDELETPEKNLVAIRESSVLGVFENE